MSEPTFYRVMFTADWRNVKPTAIEQKFEQIQNAVNALVTLLDNHYAGQWELNNGTDLAYAQAVHKNAVAGDWNLGYIWREYPPRDVLLDSIRRLDAQIAELTESRNKFLAELSSLDATDRDAAGATPPDGAGDPGGAE